MATVIGDDDFDQFDKPGSERSRRRRTSDDEWDSELDDLLEEDLLSGKKTQSDFSDEELNDDLLQSDEEDHDQQANFSSEAVTVSLNATTGMTASFELSKSVNATPEAQLDEADDDVVDEDSEEAAYAEEYTEGHYEGTDVADLTRDLMEYAEEQEEEEIDTDEVLDLAINEPLDEFLMVIKTEEEIKEESDEEEDDDEESGRLRFKTERKGGNIIRLSETARERRNIPETLELSNEDKAALMEFEERERQRKQGYYGGKRGGYARRRGAVHSHGMGDQRRDHNESGQMKDHRPPLVTQTSLGQPIRSLFQQQPIKPLLPMPRPRHSSPAQTKAESARGNNTPPSTPQQPKNIHINPHFKGSVVTPVQTPLLPTPTQPRSAAPQRFPGPPDFHPHTPSHISANFNQGPRLPPPDQWRSPPPVQEREPFFIGDPRFTNHHLFDQRSPPPPHPPPLLNSSHPMPNQGPLAFGLPGPGFNLPGQPSGFNLQGQHSGFSPPGHQPGYSPQGQQPGYNQPGPPPRFNQQGQPPLFTQGTQPVYSQPGPQPVFNQQGQQHGFTQQGQQSGFNQVQPPGFNSSGQSSGFNQHGQQSGFNQHGQQSSYNQHGQQSGYSQQGQQPGFNQQGPPHGFSRERPIRPNIQPPGLVHYNHPPRQQFTPGPGQPFLPHAQANVQAPLHHTMPPPHQTGPSQPLLPIPSSQFRPHLQTSQAQQSNNRMPRQSPMKPRHSTPSQNVGKRGNPPSLPRNSNLRELPIAPSQVTEITNSRQRSVPAAQVKPIAHFGSAAPGRTAVGARKSLGKMAKPVNPAAHPNTEVKEEQKIPDEDEETRLYRLKIEAQKRLREEILKRKEIRRQQQAGARKKELLERLAQQFSPSTQVLNQQEPPSSQIPFNSNQAVLQPAVPVRQNVKNRVLAQKQETFTTVQQKNAHFQQGAGTHLQFQAQQGEQIKLLKQMRPNRQAPQNPVQPVQKMMQAPAAQPATVLTSVQTAKVASVQGTLLERKAGVKRTVMQRANSGSGDGPHIGAKVRVIKLSGAGAEHSAFAYTEGQPQRLPISQQQYLPQQRQQQIRKVTLTKSVQQQQTQIQPTVAQGVQSIQGLQQPKKIIMRGRGRGAASQMGRGRMMPNKQNLRVVECKPQPCTVSVEGLSSSTTDFQLQSLLMSVGPIESFQMLPEQRKAIAKFSQPEHASSFQQKFHRHMIDLSHINVLLLAE